MEIKIIQLFLPNFPSTTTQINPLLVSVIHPADRDPVGFKIPRLRIARKKKRYSQQGAGKTREKDKATPPPPAIVIRIASRAGRSLIFP